MIHIQRHGLRAYFAIFCIFWLVLGAVKGQKYVSSDTNYINNAERGQKALAEGNYAFCNQCFTKALKLNQSSAKTLFNQGYCFYKRNLLDSAGIYWLKATQINFEYVYAQVEDGKMLNDKSKRTTSIYFNHCIDTLNSRYALFDTSLISQLKRLDYWDQCYRGAKMDSVRRQFGRDSREEISYTKKRNQQDSINLLEVDVLLKRCNGYPSLKMVGSQYIKIPFMIIQHDPHNNQENYLPILMAAVESDALKMRTLSLLIDRIKVSKGEKQVYGTQLFYNKETKKYEISPTDNIDKLNSLRESIGLGTIEEYLNNYNSKYGKY